ncbi:MAG: hypothetical protein WC610_03810 [Patescibacteria group bacterium]
MGDIALYRPILKKSWQITKKFKGLWFFGLFVALLGSSGEYEILSRLILKQYNSPGIISETIGGIRLGIEEGLKAGGNLWANIWSSLITNPASFIFIAAILVLSIAIVIFLIWLAIISQIGIIKNIDAINKNKKPTINEGIDFAVKNFWPVAAANVIFKIILFLLFLLVGREFMWLNGGKIFGSIIYGLAFVIFVAVVFVVSFIFKYQLFYIILKKQGIIKALKSAFQLFKENWLISLEMAAVLFIVHILVIIFTALITVMLLVAPVLLISYFKFSLALLGLWGIIDLILIIAMAFYITAILMTFTWSSWTLLYSRLTGEGGMSKIIRLARRIPNLTAKK